MEAADWCCSHWFDAFFVWGNDGFPDEPFEPFPKRRLVALASLLLGACRRNQTVVGSRRVFNNCCLPIACRISGNLRVLGRIAPGRHWSYVRQRAIRCGLL